MTGKRELWHTKEEMRKKGFVLNHKNQNINTKIWKTDRSRTLSCQRVQQARPNDP